MEGRWRVFPTNIFYRWNSKKFSLSYIYSLMTLEYVHYQKKLKNPTVEIIRCKKSVSFHNQFFGRIDLNECCQNMQQAT